MNDKQELQERAEGLMNRAKAITLKPDETWPVIAKETDAPMQVFVRYVVPLAAIGPIASFIGGQVFGYGAFGISYRPSFMGGLSQAITSIFALPPKVLRSAAATGSATSAISSLARVSQRSVGRRSGSRAGSL